MASCLNNVRCLDISSAGSSTLISGDTITILDLGGTTGTGLLSVTALSGGVTIGFAGGGGEPQPIDLAAAGPTSSTTVDFADTSDITLTGSTGASFSLVSYQISVSQSFICL